MVRLLLLSLFEQQTPNLSLIDQYLTSTISFLLETQYTR